MAMLLERSTENVVCGPHTADALPRIPLLVAAQFAPGATVPIAGPPDVPVSVPTAPEPLSVPPEI